MNENSPGGPRWTFTGLFSPPWEYGLALLGATQHYRWQHRIARFLPAPKEYRFAAQRHFGKICRSRNLRIGGRL